LNIKEEAMYPKKKKEEQARHKSKTKCIEHRERVKLSS
jgi:hypothetical protein